MICAMILIYHAVLVCYVFVNRLRFTMPTLLIDVTMFHAIHTVAYLYRVCTS